MKNKQGVIFAILKGNKIALEERNDPNDEYSGYIFIPGGKIERNESPEKAMIREIFEEYSITPGNFKKLGTLPNLEKNDDIKLRHIFLISSWKGEMKNPEGKNKHILVDLIVARELCKHPISQQILGLVELELSGENT